MIFQQLFEQESSTYTYLLADEQTKEAVLIDSVYETVERDYKLLQELGLTLKYLIDTHIHADHVTGAGSLKQKTGAKTVVSKGANVECVDLMLNDGDELKFGNHTLKAIMTPGHTNSCMTIFCEGMLFTGDVILIRGTGRTDFQQGDAGKMYESITKKIFTYPDETKIYPAHDYKGLTYTTVGLEKKFNPRVGNEKTKDEFIKIMSELKLANPKKIDVAVPANLKCGMTI